MADKSRAELETIAKGVIDEILEVLNKRLIRPHQQGEYTSADAVFVAGVALARAAAIATISQIPASNMRKEHGKRLMKQFYEMFKADAQLLLSKDKGAKDESGQPWSARK